MVNIILLIILLCAGLAEAQVTPSIKQKGNNVGPPGNSNIGTLPCIATAAAPTYTEGNQVGCSTDLGGSIRTNTGGAGGTSSNFGAAFPVVGTAAGFNDGTNMQGGRVFDGDSGVGTEWVPGAIIRCLAGGGSTACFPPTTTSADTIANQVGTFIHGLGYMYNGATWDRIRGTIAGGLLVNVSNATLVVTQSGAWTTGRTWVLASGTDSVASVQSGVWNIGTLTSITNPVAVTGTFFQVTQPVSGTVAVSNAFLLDATFTTRINTLGQKTMANSTPVVLSSDQATIPVTVLSTVSSANDDGTCPSGAASFTVVASNASRTWLAMWASPANTADVYIKLGTTATSSDARLAPGQPINFTSGRIYTGRIDAFPASGTQAVCVMELN